MSQQDFLRDLIELSADTAQANQVFEKYTSYRLYSEKLAGLTEFFPEVTVRHRNDPMGAPAEDVARNDYYAILATIIDRKWR